MASPQYNPRRQHQPPVKKAHKPRGASPTSRRDTPSAPGWVWLVAGLAIGLFIAFIVKLSNTPQPAADVAASPAGTMTKSLPAPKEEAPPQPQAETKGAEPATSEPPKTVTKFDFYTLLPEREVIVPTEREPIKTTDKPKATQEQVSIAAAAGEQYLLQVGSFRSAQEAERRRAQVGALGLQAKIESVVANGESGFRVQAGPFGASDQLVKARGQLSAAGIESLVLKQKP